MKIIQQPRQIESAKRDAADLNYKFRRDLVWRPLIRMFRRWLKNDALSIETYERIREHSLAR